MLSSQDVRTTHRLRNKLREEGRTVNWLVAELNKEVAVSRQHVSGMLNGRIPMSEEWERRIKEKLGLFS